MLTKNPGLILVLLLKSEIPTIPSIGSINLLEWLIELRKPIYSLGYPFITKDIKRYESTARWRDTQGEVSNIGTCVLMESGAWYSGRRKHSDSPTWKLCQTPPFFF